MLKRHLFILLLVGLLPLACSAQEPSAQPRNAKVSSLSLAKAAPAFTLPRLGGGSLSLADYKGKPTVVIFTTTWCPYCIEEIPELKRLYATYRTQGVGFVAVYVQESPAKVKAFARKHKLAYPVALDQNGAVARAYGVRGVPTQVLINANGQIYKNPSWNLAGDLATLLSQP